MNNFHVEHFFIRVHLDNHLSPSSASGRIGLDSFHPSKLFPGKLFSPGKVFARQAFPPGKLSSPARFHTGKLLRRQAFHAGKPSHRQGFTLARFHSAGKGRILSHSGLAREVLPLTFAYEPGFVTMPKSGVNKRCSFVI